MPYINRFINLIDANIKEELTKGSFQSLKQHGLAWQISKGDKTFAAKDLTESEMKNCIPNDANSITTYHRILNKNYSLADLKFQFGGKKDIMDETTNGLMLVFADQRKLKLNASELEEVIVKAINQDLNSSRNDFDGVQNIFVSVENSEFDVKSIFSKEFSSFKDFVKPYHMMFSISYKLECKYNKSCIAICDC